LSLPCALTILVLWLLMLQADLTPYSAVQTTTQLRPGCSERAERLMEDPLMHTTVWGCCRVARKWAAMGRCVRQAHKRAWTTIWIPLENLAGRGRPTYLVSETFLLTSKSDGKTLELAERIARRRPNWACMLCAGRAPTLRGSLVRNTVSGAYPVELPADGCCLSGIGAQMCREFGCQSTEPM